MQNDEEYKLPEIKYTKRDLASIPIELKIRACHMFESMIISHDKFQLPSYIDLNDMYFIIENIPPNLSRKTNQQMAYIFDRFMDLFTQRGIYGLKVFDKMLKHIFNVEDDSIDFKKIKELLDENKFVDLAMKGLQFIKTYNTRTPSESQKIKKFVNTVHKVVDNCLLAGLNNKRLKKYYPNFSQDFTLLLTGQENPKRKQKRAMRRTMMEYRPGGKKAKQVAHKWYQRQVDDFCQNLNDNNTVPELRQIAKNLKLTRYSHLNKKQLCKRIASHLDSIYF